MKFINKFAAIGVMSVLGVTVLVGCSSSDDPATEATTSSETSQMLPPVIVTADQTDASAVVGDMIDIVVDDPVNTTIAVDNPEVLEITQGKDDGSALFNPGAKALSPGTATIMVTSADGSIRDIVVTVS
jgi:PBP1b-binding outer membrane lipoprotein LpoB|tara:strand:+ start:2317 stop:2703 length:387 start_codon:yes stop_codon:yes gene_type:complete